MTGPLAPDRTALDAPHGLRVLRHELKNVLSAAACHLELLSRERPAKAFRSRIEAVRDALDQALGLSDRIVPEAPESGAGAVEAASLARGCVRLARAVVEGRGELVARIPRQIGEIGLCELEGRQVVLNLILNAAEAIAPGGVIRVSVRRRRDGQSIEIEVRDDGAGMSEETVARIFDPGFTSKSRGSGLGLTRVRELVEKAGGTLRIQTAPGEGTRVAVELPRVRREPGAGARAERRKAARVEGPAKPDCS